MKETNFVQYNDIKLFGDLFNNFFEALNWRKWMLTSKGLIDNYSTIDKFFVEKVVF